MNMINRIINRIINNKVTEDFSLILQIITLLFKLTIAVFNF
jgi:hypothetical protein